MSMEDEVRELKRQVSELSRKTADMPVRWAGGGSGTTSSGGGDIVFGIITTEASACNPDASASSDGEVTLNADFGVDTVSVKNYYPDAALEGQVAALEDKGGDIGWVLIDWSCKSLSV